MCIYCIYILILDAVIILLCIAHLFTIHLSTYLSPYLLLYLPVTLPDYIESVLCQCHRGISCALTHSIAQSFNVDTPRDVSQDKGSTVRLFNSWMQLFFTYYTSLRDFDTRLVAPGIRLVSPVVEVNHIVSSWGYRRCSHIRCLYCLNSNGTITHLLMLHRALSKTVQCTLYTLYCTLYIVLIDHYHCTFVYSSLEHFNTILLE